MKCLFLITQVLWEGKVFSWLNPTPLSTKETLVLGFTCVLLSLELGDIEGEGVVIAEVVRHNIPHTAWVRLKKTLF